MQRHLCWIGNRGIGFRERATLVTVKNVLDCKKWVTWLSLFPRTTAIPGFFVVAAADVVVGLAAVANKVSRLLQLVWVIRNQVMRNSVATSHWLSSDRNCIVPCDPGRPGRSADRSVIKAMRVTESFSRELIDIRSPRILAAITTHPRDAVVLAGNPENIRAVRCQSGRG